MFPRHGTDDDVTLALASLYTAEVGAILGQEPQIVRPVSPWAEAPEDGAEGRGVGGR